jgi:hypothetical protein
MDGMNWILKTLGLHSTMVLMKMRMKTNNTSRKDEGEDWEDDSVPRRDEEERAEAFGGAN